MLYFFNLETIKFLLLFFFFGTININKYVEHDN